MAELVARKSVCSTICMLTLNSYHKALWEKLPQELTSSLSFAKVMGRGRFGVVALAESKNQSFWMDNCDITGNQLRCDQGLTRVAVKMMQPGKGEKQ